MIPRESWQLPTQPITGPKRREKMRQTVIHYEGVVRDTTPADIQRHLRLMQNSYLASRGYSLGYGLAVVSDARHPDDGSAWEIRGHDLNMASNPGRKVEGNANNWTGSILLIGPTGVNASEKAAAQVRTLVTEWHAAAGTEALRPVPHNFYDWTSCCGAPYEADINTGRFDPYPTTEPPEPPTPPESELPDMMILDLNPGTDWWVAMVLDANSISHIVNGHHVSVLERGGVPRVTVNETELEGVLYSVKTLNASPFAEGMPSHNATLDGRWNAAR